jgi:hypothetical protein
MLDAIDPRAFAMLEHPSTLTISASAMKDRPSTFTNHAFALQA